MAKQLDDVLRDFQATLQTAPWDERLEDFQRLSRETQTDAKAILNHAFLLAAGLVVVALGAALIYRWTASRLVARRTQRA